MPGPGMYQNENSFVKSKSPMFGFGSSKRPNNLTKNTDLPGPGNYNVEIKKVGGY